eukprot:UN34681
MVKLSGVHNITFTVKKDKYPLFCIFGGQRSGSEVSEISGDILCCDILSGWETDKPVKWFKQETRVSDIVAPKRLHSTICTYPEDLYRLWKNQEQKGLFPYEYESHNCKYVSL